MKEKIKLFSKKYLIGFTIGAILFGSIGVYAVTYFPGLNTTYDNSDSGMTSTNVQDALDELYSVCIPPKTGSDTITDLLPDNPDELYKDENGDIRYYGPNPNNYVSFNNELWRIIGVIDGKIKIIRNESIGSYAWASNNVNSSNNWDNSSLKSYLNGGYYNSIDSTYRNMISEETYFLGGPSSSNYLNLTPSDYYTFERDSRHIFSGNPASTTQKIGLMYPSDYGYAAGSSCLSTALYYFTSCYKNDYLFSEEPEWLQSPIYNGGTYAVHLRSTGGVDGSGNGGQVYASYGVRPVLYLTSEVKITGGDGSQSNPYTLE